MLCLQCTFILTILLMYVCGKPENRAIQFLSSSYSKVARSGSSGAQSQGRSHSSIGQTPWTHSSDAHVVRGQNLALHWKNNNKRIIANKKDTSIKFDNIGEVIQERFNPRPWVAYEAIKGPAYIPPSKPSNDKNPQPDFTLSVPFDSFPMSLKSSTDKPSSVLKPPFDTTNLNSFNNNQSPIYYDTNNLPPTNSYDSPYDSYNPTKTTDNPANFVTQTPESNPPPKIENQHNNHQYLPPEIDKPSKEMNNFHKYVPPTPDKPEPYKEENDNEGYHGYLPPEKDKPPKEINNFDEYAPPLPDEPTPQKEENKHPGYHGYLPPEMDRPPKNMYNFHQDHEYIPPETDSFSNHAKPPNEDNHHHDNHGYLPPEMDTHPDEEMGPPTKPKDNSKPYIHQVYDHPFSNDDDDHSPPEKPTLDSHNFGKLPEYLDHDPHENGHNFGQYFHFDHHPHIYHEVKTTTPAPEDKRLSKIPYSYYYIGRKLWYIPLYFSVYFIIYVMVLILKSIARHKITFNQYFEDDKREMKDEHEIHEEHVHEISDQVLQDMHAARRKYIM